MPGCRNCRWGVVLLRRLSRSILPTAATRRVTPGSYTSAATAESNKLAYHRGGPAKLEVFATWADYKKAGPLLSSLDHHGTRNGDPLHLSS